MRVDRGGVQVSPSVLALETEPSCVMLCAVASMEEFNCRALIECLQVGGSCSPYLLGDSVR
jgi:hypothetical protein